MIEIAIPGAKTLRLSTAIFDFNATTSVRAGIGVSQRDCDYNKDTSLN